VHVCSRQFNWSRRMLCLKFLIFVSQSSVLRRSLRYFAIFAADTDSYIVFISPFADQVQAGRGFQVPGVGEIFGWKHRETGRKQAVHNVDIHQKVEGAIYPEKKKVHASPRRCGRPERSLYPSCCSFSLSPCLHSSDYRNVSNSKHR